MASLLTSITPYSKGKVLKLVLGWGTLEDLTAEEALRLVPGPSTVHYF
jgi:hypothetical protein